MPLKHGAYFFTTREAPGALKNGTRVRKVRTEASDSHAIGDRATVLGSLSEPKLGLGYFVEWDDAPGVPVFVVGWKLAEAEPHS